LFTRICSSRVNGEINNIDTISGKKVEIMSKARDKVQRVIGEKTSPERIHFDQIDILKGLAIISVIFIHTYDSNILLSIGAPFYFWQAVPVFLLLAAFTSSSALSSSRKITLLQCYDLSILSRRLKRILGPFLVIWIVQFIIIACISWSRLGIVYLDTNVFRYAGINIIFNFLSGGNGPGYYFIPVILQQILFIPLLYYLARRSPVRMLAAVFILELLLGYLSVILGVPAWLFTILYIQYMVAGAFGVWLIFEKHVVNKWIMVGGLIGGICIVILYYLNFQFWILDSKGIFFRELTYLYTLLIVVMGIQYLPNGSDNRIFRVLTELGNASWHIFLVQMTFFFCVFVTLYKFLISDVLGPGFPGFLIIAGIINLMLCLTIGYGFYILYQYAGKKVKWLGQ
jgi:peptidoglycan/LPS O-acetylase OafA/YrhL